VKELLVILNPTGVMPLPMDLATACKSPCTRLAPG